VDYRITEKVQGEELTGEVMPLTEEQLHITRMGDKFERTQPPTKKKRWVSGIWLFPSLN